MASPVSSAWLAIYLVYIGVVVNGFLFVAFAREAGLAPGWLEALFAFPPTGPRAVVGLLVFAYLALPLAVALLVQRARRARG